MSAASRSLVSIPEPAARVSLATRLPPRTAGAACPGAPPSRPAPGTAPAQHVAALRRMADGDAAPATVNCMRSALRGVLRSDWRLGLIDAEHLARTGDVPGLKARRLPRGRHVASGEIAALFRECSIGPSGARDAALLALLYGCGLRRAEAVALDAADYEANTATITVIGKGGHQRQVFATVGARAALDAWVAPAPGATSPARCCSRSPRAGASCRGGVCPPRLSVRESTDARQAPRRAATLPARPAALLRRRARRGRRHRPGPRRCNDRRGERAARRATDRLHVPYTTTDLTPHNG